MILTVLLEYVGHQNYDDPHPALPACKTSNWRPSMWTGWRLTRLLLLQPEIFKTPRERKVKVQKQGWMKVKLKFFQVTGVITCLLMILVNSRRTLRKDIFLFNWLLAETNNLTKIMRLFGMGSYLILCWKWMLFKNQEKIFQFLTFLLLNTWSASSVFARFSHTFHCEKYQKKVKKKRNGETHKDVIKKDWWTNCFEESHTLNIMPAPSFSPCCLRPGLTGEIHLDTDWKTLWYGEVW